MAPSLSSWSWGDIQRTYLAYGTLFGHYAAIDKRIKIPRQMNIKHSDESNLFILRFWRDIDRVDAQLKALDAEIARRNNLIGVMG